MITKINAIIGNLEQSAIRAISFRCAELNGINLGQGICDHPVHPAIKQAAIDAINHDKNIYVPMQGISELRQAIAQKMQGFNKVPCAEDNVLVTHGATGAFVSAAKTLFSPGDEVILFEPFYGYHKKLLEMLSIQVKALPLVGDNYALDVDALRSAIGPRTRAILICTPCNPCGKVFTREELIAMGDLAIEKDLYVLTDEMYEYITYPGHEHCSLASLGEQYFDRTITISGFSKTYNITGWRMGYLVAAKDILEKIALANDLFYICAASSFQYACLAALSLPQSYYTDMRAMYLENRDFFVNGLREIGFSVTLPKGAYYTLADFSKLRLADSDNPAMVLLEETRVAAVDGRAFYNDEAKGRHIFRFCFSSSKDQLEKALEQMSQSQLLRSK